MIALLEKCVQLNSLFAPAYDLLAQTYALFPGKQKEAIGNSIMAVRLKPGNLDYAVRLTQLLLINDRDAEAKIIAAGVSKAAYTPEEREMAQGLVVRVANHKERVANGSGAAPPMHGGSFEVGGVIAAGPGASDPGSDRPPEARKLLLGVDGTLTTVDCSKSPEIKLTMDGSGGFIDYRVADVGKISITVPGDGSAPECSHWPGRKVKLWFTMVPGEKMPGEVTKLNFQ